MLKNKIIVKKIRNIFILLMAIIIMLGAYHNIRNSKAENVIQIELEIADKSNILSAQTITVDATETSDGNYLINLPISVNKNIVSKYYTSSGEEIEVDVENNIATMQLTEEEVANKKAQLQTDYDTKEVTDAKSGEKKLLYKKLLTNEPVTEEHDETSKSNEATQSNSTTKNETSAQKETEKQSEIKNATQDSQNTDNKENEENQDVIATGYMPIDAKMEVKEIDLATLTSVKIPDEKQTMQKAYEVSIYQMVEKKKDESNSESNSASTNSDEANAGKAQTNSDATNENQTQETYDVTNTNEAQTNPDSTLNSETEGANKTTDVNTETNTNSAVDSETQNVEMERVEYDPSIYDEKVTIITKNEQVNVITTIYALEKDNKVAKVESTTDNAKNETKFETEKTGETVKYVIATEEIPADVNNTTDNDTITSDDKINNSDDVTTTDNDITNVGAGSSTTSTPTWRVENINKDKTNKRVTADLVVASANFTSVNDSTLTTDDITVTVDGEVNKIITKNLGTPTFSTNASTGLKEIKYILTLDNWEEAARQAGKSFLEYSGSVKIEIAEGIESSKPSELFDQDGSNTNGLHIGDFINYDAGTWTQDEINSIRTGLKTNLQTANGSTNLPTKGYQFGGFAAGSSRNGNATPYDDTYNYIKDTSTNSAITGWRVFDVDGDNVTLISAGNPEGYYHENRSTSGYISEYVLSGNINSNFSASTANQYQKRDWNVYINEKQKATNAIPLTKSRLDTWYTKYLSITNANTDHKSTVQKIYNETYVKIQNIIDNYSHYFLAETITVNSDCLCTFNPNSRRVLYANKGAEGVRILITLSSDVLFGSTKTGTKTLTGGNMDTYGGNQTYNCWNIVTGNSSGSTGSSQKQVLDLGQVDFINPEYTYKYANTEIDHDKKKVTVVFDVTDKYFSTSALTTDTIASNITVNFEGKEATNATKELSKLSDITETINGTTKKVGEKYQLVVSNLDQGNGGDYSGIMTLVFRAGIVTDTSNNNSVAKTITIGVDDPIDTGSTDGPYLPTGFTHVEGTSLENGYTVQDSEGNQFVWVEVPKTAEVYSTAGLNITEFTTDAYTKIENDLHTYTSAYREEECTDEWAENAGDTQATIGMTNEQYSKLKQKMLRSVYQNGGFYIGKYETGIEGTPRTSGDANTMPTETPVIKQNAYPYNYVTSSQAQTIASGFTSNLDGYTSSLLFGVQWDLTLKYLETKGATQAELKKDSNAWGNYYTSLWNITNTSSKYSTDKGSTWKKGAYGKKSSSVGVLLSTGASDKFTKQGIYDLAGNVYEWTLEAYSSYSTYACISRGGSYRTSDISGARSRDIFNNSTDTNDYIGYRVALYKDSTQNSSSDTSDSKKPVIVDVVDPIWKVENVNINKTNKKVTADLIATDKYLTGVENSTLTIDDITLTIDGETNTVITKTLSAPTFSENASTGLKEIKYTLTLDNWEESARQAGKSFLEYSGSAKIIIKAGTVIDSAGGSSGVKPSELFDQDGSNTNGLHIGDFVDYDAGTWTQEEIKSIKTGLKTNLKTANGTTALPTSKYQFGGFETGSSRNENATFYYHKGYCDYIKDATTNTAITGWRVFDIDGDSTTLITAGNPEDYFHEHPNGNDGTPAYESEYVLTGNVNSGWSAGTSSKTKYQIRDWSMYVNEEQKATSAIPLTNSRLSDWCDKYMGGFQGDSTIEKLYQESYIRYQNIFDNYSYYWLGSASALGFLSDFEPDERVYMNGITGGALGIRMLVTLSSDVLFNSKTTGTKTLTGGNMDTYGGNQTYNCWSIVTGSNGNANGENNSSKEQTLDLGQVDFINPEFTYKYSNTTIDHDKKKVTVIFDIADKCFNTSALTTDSTASNITVNFEGKEATNATKELSKLSDITATINGTEKKVGEKYQLVVSNLDQGNGGDYSGIMTLVFPAGIATDLSNNSSLAKTITIGVDDPSNTDGSDGPYLPTGFTHVEGTSLDNGYTVQDSKGNQFVWVEVPKTANVYKTAGLNITEFTTDAYTKIENDLHTYTSVYRENGYTDEWVSQTSAGMTSDQYTELRQKMLKSIYQNGGFYIGKYETGIEGTPRTSGNADKMPTETPVIKQNAYPYNYVTNSQAQTIASGFASDLDGYTSSLLFGVQWDLTLKYLETKGATQAELNSDSTNWGNYSNNLWNITNTNSKYLINNGSTWTNGAYGKKSSNDAILLSTGASDTFSKQGIYDLAGNVYEWTLEANSFDDRALRGGNYTIDRSTASDRYNDYPTNSNDYIGSRLALYKDVALANDSDAPGTGSKPVIVDVVNPVWKVENVNINKTNKKVTADLIATDKYLTGVENSTLTTDDITISVDGDENANNVITKTLSTPTFSSNKTTGLKEIRYTLTLENWEESAKQAGKSFLEYSGSAKIIIKAGTVTDSAGGSSGVKPSELFDQDGSNTNGLHIGDFVDYDAGTWTQDEINSIKTGLKTDLQTANGTATLPTNGFQFGGFTAGSSRNGNATPYTYTSSSVTWGTYIKDASNNSEATGWRVFDIDGDNVTLISAGNPEDYYHKYSTDYGYVSEYVLTGNVNSSWGTSESTAESTYQKRDWGVYVNEKQKATNAIPLTEPRLNSWYTKYTGTENANINTDTTFQKIYEEPYIRYQNMIENDTYCWLPGRNYGNTWCMSRIDPSNRSLYGYIEHASDIAYGIRMLVVLSSDVQFKSQKTGTKTLTGGNMDKYGGNQTYNCWSIATGSNGNANGENNSSKEQTLDLGHVDFIKPSFTYKYANTEINHDTKTVTVVFDITDKYFSASQLATDAVASNIKVNFEGKEATNATKVLTKLSDITETVNGVENTKVGEKYQLVVSNLDQGDGGDYSGIMTLVFPAGIVTDTSSNSSFAKTITIGVDEDGSKSKGAKPSELFDQEGSRSDGLHIGDFVNYDAGTWTQNEINSIQTGLKTNLQTANGSTDLPANTYQFGGFTAGSSRNENATPNTNPYGNVSTLTTTYLKDKSTNSAITGWRVFDIDGDNITLISAGNPEDYRMTSTSHSGDISEYILTGNVNTNNKWTTEDSKKYQKRDWGLYVNSEQKATSAIPLTYNRLKEWYAKYTGGSLTSSTSNIMIYEEPYIKYQSMMDNNSYYWLCSSAAIHMFWMETDNRQIYGGSGCAGVRMLVTLSPDVLLSSERTGTKTLTGGNMDTYGGDQTFNCWNIVTATEGESGSKDPVIVDVVDPVWKVENVKQDTENQKVTLDLVATDKYLTGVENSTLTTDDITISVDGDENANNAIKKTLSEPTFSGDGPYIPTGYSHVAGTSLDNGFTVQDSKGNQFVWVEVPKTADVYPTAGLKITEFTTDAYTKIENDLHTYTSVYRIDRYTDEWGTNENNYSQDSTGMTSDQYTELKQKMLRSVYQNGGFYIGKYETGIENTYRTSGSANTTPTETPVIKQNAYPYNYVKSSQAQTIASGFASNLNGYTSSLLFGVQWDLTLKYLETKGATQAELKEDSTNWGNYYDNLWNITNTNSKYSTDYGDTWTNGAYGKKTGGVAILLSTGASDTFSKQGIHDLAGNVHEWTLEAYSFAIRAYRGGFYGATGRDTASIRYNGGPTDTHTYIGSRLALYKNVALATDSDAPGTGSSVSTGTTSGTGSTSTTDLKEIRYTLTLDNWEEAAKQAGKSYYEYSGATTLKIAAGTITDDATGAEEGISDGKRNTSKEQTLDIGKIDILRPVIERETAEVNMGDQTATVVFNVSDKYLNTSDTITANDITVILNGTETSTVTKTITRVTENDATATIEGTEKTVLQQYKLVLSGLGSNIKQLKIRIAEGSVIDLNGNGNVQKNISIYNTLKTTATESKADSAFLGNSSIQRQNIENITFERSIPKTVYNEATGKFIDTTAWDVSASEDNSIIAWYETSNTNGAIKVHIGSEDEIFANTNSAFLFSYIGYADICTATETITNISLLNVSGASSMYAMFQFTGYKSMTSLDLGSNFNTQSAKNMSFMFNGTGYMSMTNLNLGSKFIPSKVTNMKAMFQSTGYTAMTSLDLGENFDTSKVTDMSYMFFNAGYTAMTSLNLGNNFDTSSATTMSAMFSKVGYTALESLDLKNKFNTSNVTTMRTMFENAGYTAMTSLNLGENFDTSSVTDMSYMFNKCGYTAMDSLNLGNKFNTSNVTNMFVMFQHTGHTKMTSLDLGDKFDTSSVTDMTGMFLGTGYVAMTSLNLRDKFDTSNVTSMYATFQETGYTAMTSLYLGDKFDTSKVTNMKDMFYKTGALSMTNLDFGPAFTKIADNHEDMFIDTGKNGEVVINVPESIYKNRKSFKLSSTDSTTAEGTLIVNSIVREADDGTKTLSERDVTVVPKYKPEWTVTSTVVDKANKALKINLKGATNANNYTSDVTTALDANAISIWIDGEEITGVSKTVTTANPSTGASVTQIITLTDFEEAVRQAGKSYKEWSGNITLKIAGRGEATSTYTANILTDKYGNQSMSASDETGIWIDVDFKDATLGTSSEDGKMFTDFITPEFTYEYANTTIDHDTKKVTVVFDITDKYFDKSSLSEDTTASQITVDFEGTEATNATKELTKLSDITATINGVENTKIGEKYKLVVSNLDQGQGGDYSGIMKLAFKAGELNADGSLKSGMVDKSGNLSIDKTITIGVDEPKTDGENNNGVIVDVVDPIWKVENINIDSASQKVTAEVIATDKYLTGIANSTLTTNDITITVDGDANANNVITKTLSEPTFSENASTGLKEIRYILTLENWEEAEKQTGKSFLEYSGTTKITIAEGTVTDNAGGSNGVSPSSLFDQAGSNTNGLHIGDFVDYDAGTWTQEEINSIKTGLKTNLQTANGSTSLPTKEFQFGGFTAGSSRNGNATPYNTSYNYVKNVATGNAVTGWRVFDIDEDSVTLISAGNPEDYYEKYVTNSENGYIYEYILSGNVSDQWSTGQTEKDKYKVRDWTVYINKKQKATNAMPLTMDKIYTWSEKYLGDTLYGKIYQSTYIKYQSLIDNYSYYFVATNANKDRLYASNPKSTENNFIFNSNFLGSNALGIRMIVTLSSDVLFNPEKTGTKTLTGGNMDTYGGDQTYNCWSIATGGISDGKHNTSKEQTFELGHVDFIKPRIEKESSVRDVEAKTETITFNVVDKYLDTTKILTADDIKVLVDGEEATTLTKTFTRVAENDTSAMVNGSTQVVSQQYQLVLSGFDVGRTEEEANRSFANWSGTVTIEVAEGKIKDQENEIASNGGISGGNANEATTIKGDFVDYINPELIYKHQDVDINKEGKTYTMTFTVTDKYYKSGIIKLEDLTINMQNGQLDAEGNEKIYNLKNEEGIEIALRAEEITAQDVPITGTTGDVESASDLLIGHKYTLTISHLEQLEIKEGATTADYSGIITVAVPANKVLDKGPSGNGTSSNGNIATTVTSGANIPGGTIPDDAKVVDVVTPIWTKVTSSASAIDPADKTTSTATVKFRGTDTYFATNTLTEEQIKVFVNGTEVTTGITKTLSEATALNEQRKAFGSDTITTKQYGVEYTLTITGFAQNADQVKVQIPAGCMTDEFGNSNKVTDLIVYNVLRNTTSENSETGAFLGNASIQRQNIENVTFERSIPSTVYNTETGEYVDTTAWDASARQDKSIIAWYETSNSNGALKVHIGSNDEIFGNQNSSYLFRAIGYSNICTATEAITNIGLLNVSSVTNMECMFWQTGWNAMTNFNLGDKFDTGNVTNMRKMLSGVGYNAMTDISLGSEFDTGKVTDMSRMFENTGYYAMKKFDLGDKFDTSSVKDMSYMFTHCGVKLMTDIDLGEDFNTENVTNMNYMFYSIGATAMTSLDLGDKFDTSKVTTMEAMFSGTGNTAMTSLDLGEKFDTRKVTNMKSMFQGCGATAMTTLNLGPAFTKIPAESTNFMTNCGTTGLVIYAPESVYANNGEFIISEN